MKDETLEKVKKFEERRKIGFENNLKKKDSPLIISAVGK